MDLYFPLKADYVENTLKLLSFPPSYTHTEREGRESAVAFLPPLAARSILSLLRCLPRCWVHIMGRFYETCLI